MMLVAQHWPTLNFSRLPLFAAGDSLLECRVFVEVGDLHEFLNVIGVDLVVLGSFLLWAFHDRCVCFVF